MEKNLLDCQRSAEENIVRIVLETPLFSDNRKKQRLAAYPTQEGYVRELVVHEVLKQLLESEGVGTECLRVFQKMDNLLGSIGIRKSFVHQFEVFLLGASLLELVVPTTSGAPSLTFYRDREEIFTDWLYCTLFHDICKPRQNIQKVLDELNLLIAASGGDKGEVVPPRTPAHSPEVKSSKVLKILQDGLSGLAGRAIAVNTGSHGALGAEWFLSVAERKGHDENRRNSILTAIALHDYSVSDLAGMKATWNSSSNLLASLLLICDNLQDWERTPNVAAGDFVEQYLRDFRFQADERRLYLSYVYRWGVDMTRDQVIEKIVKPKAEVLGLFSRQLGSRPLEVVVSAWSVEDDLLGTIKFCL